MSYCQHLLSKKYSALVKIAKHTKHKKVNSTVITNHVLSVLILYKEIGYASIADFKLCVMNSKSRVGIIVKTVLLSFSVLKELKCNLLEERVGKNVLLLLKISCRNL